MNPFVAMVITQIRKACEAKHVLPFFSHGSLSTFIAPFQSWTGAQISEQSSRDARSFKTFPSFNCPASWYGCLLNPHYSVHTIYSHVEHVTWWQLFTMNQNSCWTSSHACHKIIHPPHLQVVLKCSVLQCFFHFTFNLTNTDVGASPWTPVWSHGATLRGMICWFIVLNFK